MRIGRLTLIVPLLLAAGCGSGGSEITATSVPATTVRAELAVPAGTWSGSLSDPTSAFDARFLLQDCVPEATCGELEYFDPTQPEFVLCAPELLYHGIEGEEFVFEEQPGFRSDQCFPTTLRLRYVDDDTFAVDQYGEPGTVCCTGTFDKVSDQAPPPATVPALDLSGLDGPLSITDLDGPTTQYVAVGDDAMWFPVNGRVQRLDPETGRIVGTIDVGDGDDGFGDPHAVAASHDAIWVAVRSVHAVSRIDPATNQVVESIPLDVTPYALAIDGADLWVSSFDDDAVVRVDTATGEQTARLDVKKPTGIAVGGGSTWVVQHRDDSLVRIDPATNTAVATIPLGASGDNPLCGMCVENVIYAFGAVWTPNNYGRSITRVDPVTNVTAEIEVEHRVWAVAADDESIWASQFEATDDDVFDLGAAGVARVDPATRAVEQLPLHGVISVAAGHGSVWIVVLGPRSDHVWRFGD